MAAEGLRHWRIQLHDALTRAVIQTAGGVAYVAEHDGAAKETLKTASGGAASNPVSLNRGLIEFYTDASVDEVDLYIACPTGHFLVAKGVRASGPNELYVDTNQRHQCMVIPWDQTDFTANTETDSGFDEPANALILPNMAVLVTSADSTETIDVGTLSSDSGDADGFIDGASIASTGLVKASLANGAVTLGALMSVQDSANNGDKVPEGKVSQGKSITYTTSAGSDTGAGFILLPYLLAA